MNKINILSHLSKHLKRSLLLPPCPQSLNRFARHDFTPLATLQCKDMEDIRTAIQFCNDNNVQFTVRSGGSNQACTSIREGSLILDLRDFKEISHQKQAGKLSLTFQGGANFHDIQAYLSKYNAANNEGFGLPYAWYRGISGVGAHTVMGNGLLNRKCGVGVDLIKSAKVMLGSGEIVTADKVNNADLLWAVKGCGTNMGAILELTEELPEQTCNSMDPLAGKEIRVSSISFSICDKVSKIGSDISLLYQNLSDNVFPYTMLLMNKKFSSVMLMNYEMLYDRQLKKINYTPNHVLEQELRNLMEKYNGKSYYEGGHTFESVASVQVKAGPKKQYFKLWGGSTTLSQLPQVLEDLANFYQANPLHHFKDNDMMLGSFIVYIDSQAFRARDPTSTSWPNSREETIIIYGNLAYTNRQLHQECGDYINRLESTIKRHLKFGSACDYNTPIADPNLAQWIYGPNYSRLKQIKQKYDPLNKFGNNLF